MNWTRRSFLRTTVAALMAQFFKLPELKLEEEYIEGWTIVTDPLIRDPDTWFLDYKGTIRGYFLVGEEQIKDVHAYPELIYIPAEEDPLE